MKDKSVTGVLANALPFAVFFAGAALFLWNEYRTARLSRVIRRAEKEVVELDLRAPADPALEGKLVHACGVTSCAEPLRDPDLGVEADALVLKRDVSYYQVTEYYDNLTDQYTYNKDWCDTPLSSKDYKAAYRDANFAYVRLSDRKDTCTTVALGPYLLQADLVGWLRDFSRDVQVNLPPSEMQKLSSQAAAASKNGRTVKVRAINNYVYIGRSPDSPEVGDVLIEYSAIPHSKVSVLAKIEGGRFVKYGSQKEFFIYNIVPGEADAAYMLEQERSSNRSLGWVLRGIALALLALGAPGAASVIKKSKAK